MKWTSETERAKTRYVVCFVLVSVLAAALTACRSNDQPKERNEFFTSGSREADQRASQRMAKEDQLAGPGSDQKKEKKGEPAVVENKTTLYERLGKEAGIAAIVEDFIKRAIEDPRVNWARQGQQNEGFFSFWRKGKKETQLWKATPEAVAKLKQHFVQFLSLATGGPPRYDGQEMKQIHAGMQITNPEFDAAVGDLKASLDRLQIADREQKELLAIIESTRPQVVTKR